MSCGEINPANGTKIADGCANELPDEILIPEET